MSVAPEYSSDAGDAVSPLRTSGRSADTARLLLGVELRELRREAGMMIREVNHVIRASISKVSRIETGGVKSSERDVRDLLRHYNADAHRTRVVMTLWRQTQGQTRWSEFGDAAPGWLRRLISLEQDAEKIRTYETHSVPGLLQTSQYTRALVSAGMPGLSDEDVERRVRLRAARQEVLHGNPHLTYVAFLDESVLGRTVGGPAVMRDQLKFLLDMHRHKRARIKVVPLDKSAIAPTLAFTLLKISQRPSIVYVETPVGATYVNAVLEVEQYKKAIHKLTRTTRDTSTEEKLREAIQRYS